MKVSLNWLKKLVEYNLTPEQLAEKLSLMSIGVKDITSNYLELDLTYNRGDLLSLRGVAREVAAITGSKIISADSDLPKFDLPKTAARVEDEKLCPVYCLAKVEGLRVTSSPNDWVKKLTDSGVRSVNNVADITNLIMLEYGQPMHAFDNRAVKDEEIIVRTAKKGERITTLDGKTRDLDPSDLLIADPELPLGIAGVMGGKDSEINDSTTTILLEAAIFDPTFNRRTSKRHGLYSEATKRFQHGLTKINLLQALKTAIKMYEDLGGKLTAITLIGDLEDKPKNISLNLQKINDLIGIQLTKEDVEQSLQSLGFHPKGAGSKGPKGAGSKGAGSNSWEVTVPYWRLDIETEEDLVEEVARIYGYDKIKGKALPIESTEPLDQSLPKFIADLKAKLRDLGLTEIQSYSFYSTAVLEALGFTSKDLNRLVKVANPISTETEYLRDNLWPNLVEVVGKNLRHGFKDIAIFEINKIYLVKGGDLPDETYRLSIALMNGSNNPSEVLISLFKSLALHTRAIRLNPAVSEVNQSFHPNRFVSLEKDSKQIGILAEIHLRVLNKLGLEKRVAILELNLETLV